MEIILKKNTPSLGKMGNVVRVKDGHARNYLIPRGIGIEATVKKEEDKKLAQEIEGLSLSFSKKTGEEDRIFGSVTSIDIEARLKENNIQIDRKKIHLKEPIKALGIFTIPVKLHTEVTANLRVLVVKE